MKTPVQIDIDTDDDDDPYYEWQEEMSHRAKSDRITYGQWIKRELDRLRECDRAAAMGRAQ